MNRSVSFFLFSHIKRFKEKYFEYLRANCIQFSLERLDEESEIHPRWDRQQKVESFANEKKVKDIYIRPREPKEFQKSLTQFSKKQKTLKHKRKFLNSVLKEKKGLAQLSHNLKEKKDEKNPQKLKNHPAPFCLIRKLINLFECAAPNKSF